MVAYSFVQPDKHTQEYIKMLRIAKVESGALHDITVIKNAHSPLWCGAEDKIAYLSSEVGCTQLYEYSMGTMSARRLTSMRNGVYDPIISPDGRYIYFGSRSDITDNDSFLTTAASQDELNEQGALRNIKPYHIKDKLFRLEGTGYLEGKRGHIWRLDTETLKCDRLTDGQRDFRHHNISKCGRYLTYVSEPLDNVDCDPLHSVLWLHDIETGSSAEVKSDYFSIEYPSVLYGGKEILFVGHNCKCGWATVRKIYKLKVATGELTDLTADFKYAASDTAISDMRCAESPFRLIVDEKQGCCYFLCNFHGITALMRCGFNGKVTAVSADKRQIFHASANGDCTSFMISWSNWRTPCDISLLNIEAGAEIRLTEINKELVESRIVYQPQEIDFECDGISHVGWIIRSDSGADCKCPSILEIHGGPQMMYANNFMLEFQYLAGLGYVVYYCNPRGSSGFGQKFMDAIRRSGGGIGGADFRDIMALSDAVIKFPFIDTENMFVTGGSYGGYMTNWIIGHTNRYKAAVTQRSICNIESYIVNSDYGYCKPTLEYEIMWPEEKAELKRISPITYVESIETPLLIMHSEHDYRCTLEQAIQLYTQLKMRNREVEMKIFPRSNHGLSRTGIPALRVERLLSISEWFNKYNTAACSGR